jgi:pimeloyl-ACP methyl ester carboxylesterase
MNPSIVFIHGLGGHREGTWTATEPHTGRTVLWIKDFLPAQLPYARIMTYGYSSQVFSIKHLTQRILYSHSKALLSALEGARKNIGATNRPVIFISHSLGGIVAKSALIHANNDIGFKDILLSTAGMVFFGTPHQGAPDSQRSWINIVGDLVGRKIDCSRMRNTLDSDLGWLQFQLEQYKSLDAWFPTHCLYEAEPSGSSCYKSLVSQLSY